MEKGLDISEGAGDAKREFKHITLALAIEGLECAVGGLEALSDNVHRCPSEPPPKRALNPKGEEPLKGLSLACFLDIAPKRVHELEVKVNDLVVGIRKALF